MWSHSVVVECILAIFISSFETSNKIVNGENDQVIPPSKCEVCKFLAIELKDRLEETGKSKEVLEIGHGLDPSKKKAIKYNTAELRLIEALNDPHICEKILEYNIHKERKGSARFAKGQSETFQTLHNLVDKGVKVDLGIPYELWDKPSAEVTQLQRECFTIVEEYEEIIEDWYFNSQHVDIIDYLCRDRVLKHDNQSCLDEIYDPKDKISHQKDEKGKTSKKKKNKGSQKGETAAHTEL